MNTKTKLQLNKSAIMQLTQEKKLSDEQMEQIDGGKPKVCSQDNQASWYCCSDTEHTSFCGC